MVNFLSLGFHAFWVMQSPAAGPSKNMSITLLPGGITLIERLKISLRELPHVVAHVMPVSHRVSARVSACSDRIWRYLVDPVGGVPCHPCILVRCVKD